MALHKKHVKQEIEDAEIVEYELGVEEEKLQEVVQEEEVDPKIIVELGLNASQLCSLRWVLICWLGQYESGGGS